jgi:hypothetical protein
MTMRAYPFALMVLTACAEFEPTPEAQPGAPTVPTPTPTASAPTWSAAQTQTYLSQLAPFLVQRALKETELTQIETNAGEAIRPILSSWSQEAGFAEAARNLVASKFSLGGTRDGIDFELPGNLVAHVVRQQLPWSTILTADYCVTRDGQKKPCAEVDGTGAPFIGGGILATRAYLASREGRFNLTRASTMMEGFACLGYPMDDLIQPKLAPDRLRELFASDAPTNIADGAGNSAGCYTCHAQFGVHAQLFVKFDDTGRYRPEADGIQDPAGELGRTAKPGLMASHLRGVDAASEASNMFGQPTQHLADATQALTKNPVFITCQISNIIELAVGFRNSTHVPESVAAGIARRATQNGTIDPTFGSLMTEVFTDVQVQTSILNSFGGGM